MDWQSVLTAAVVRAFIISVCLGLLALLGALQAGQPLAPALIQGAYIAVSAFLLRGFGEGGYDVNRANTGQIHASDIGAQAVTRTISGTPPEGTPPAVA